MKTSRKRWGLSSGLRALLVVFLLSIFCPHGTAAQPTRLGDLDGDGVPTVIDLQRLLNHINSIQGIAGAPPAVVGASPTTLPIPLLGYADVTGDGYINQADVDMLAKAILGTPITTVPRLIIAEPASGASEVGVTVRPRVYFPKPIIPATLNANNFYASFAGRKLPARIVPANDGTFAWLFLDPPMPGASQVQVTVDGSTVSVLSGEILDADADLAPGGMFRFNFSTVSVAGIPGTVLSSRIVDPGPDLIPRTADDVVLAAGYQYLLPIAGVKVYVLGLESNFAYTDANGRFTLTNMPVGNVKVVLDGRTATSPPAGYYFPEMVIDTHFEPGITNGVMNIVDTNGVVVRDPNGVPIRALAMYLPRIASNVLQTVSATNPTMITLQSNAAYTLSPTQQQYLTVEIMPGSLIGVDGQPMSSGQVGISVVPPELVRDMLPPGLLQHTFDITVQAPGISTFATPAPMTFPNVFNAPPGTKLNFLSFDHTTGRLVIEGTATVSADGLYVTTDPGTGITHPGWHGLAPPGVNAKGTKPDNFPKDDGCGNQLQGILRKKDTCIKSLDPCLSFLFSAIVRAFQANNAGTPVISSGNDSTHHGHCKDANGTSSIDWHYCNKAIDISGSCGHAPNVACSSGRIVDAVMRNILAAIQASPEFSSSSCTYFAQYEFAGSGNNHIHIQVTSGPCCQRKEPCECPATAAAFGGTLRAVEETATPLPPYDVLITTTGGTEPRLKTYSEGAFTAFLPPETYGIVHLLARNGEIWGA